MSNDFTFGYLPRTDTPLIVGLSGPSSSGKTGSALELAHGFQEVQGGDIGMGDSEAGRGNHYQGASMFSDKTKRFKYKYTEFGAPFSPENYTRMVEGAVKQGIKHLIIDSTSHLHEGVGGILEWHEREVERLAKAWGVSADKANIPAWGKPKAALSAFRNFFTQQKINLIFCFRAKEKIKLIGGKPSAQGFQPIISEELVFEMTASFLLYPGAQGVPTFTPDEQDEKKVIKVPEYFKPVFEKDPKRALSAWHGKQMARWAKGGTSQPESQPAPATPPAQAPANAPTNTPSNPSSDIL